tara:strand:+ start:642 stop:893 length:252 start_codon:yes stop_codon:yes gene_type:complete
VFSFHVDENFDASRLGARGLSKAGGTIGPEGLTAAGFSILIKVQKKIRSTIEVLYILDSCILIINLGNIVIKIIVDLNIYGYI